MMMTLAMRLIAPCNCSGLAVSQVRGEWVSVRRSRLSLTGGVGQCETEPTVTDWGSGSV